ncbi:MAG: PDZ domain-containing protein, partial [Tepidisphaeraceae bacterium]
SKIVCITDETGEQELAIFDAKGKDPHKVLTHQNKGWIFSPTWAPDGKTVAYADMTGTLYTVDPESGESKVVDHDPNWEITEYDFSPDGKWLAYTKLADNRVQQVWLYNLADGSKQSVSAGFTSDFSPTWDPTGKYLYFLSNRSFNPFLDDLDRSFLVTRSVMPCCVILAKDGKSPFLADELLDADREKDKKKDDKGDSEASPSDDKDDSNGKDDDDKPEKDAKDAKDAKDDKKPRKLPEVKVDLAGIEQRVVEFPLDADNYADLDASKNKVYYLSHPTRGLAQRRGERRDLDLHVFDLKKKKDEVILEDISGYTLSGDGGKLAYRKGKEILVIDAGSKPGKETEEKVALAALPLEVETEKEWAQIFNEAWRLQRDFYWADNMGGVDWPAMKKKYEPLVARAGSRGELSDIISQLFGELGTSHTYVFGGDSSYPPVPNAVPIGVLGADIEIDKATGLHRFSRVLRPEVWETDIAAPLTLPHANVRDGDYLLAINGRELKPTDNSDSKLTNLAGVEVLLTVCSKPDKSDARDAQVKTLSSDSDLRYRDWCRRNREYVASRSSGRIGYMHLPDMSGDGLVAFIRGFYPQFRK